MANLADIPAEHLNSENYHGFLSWLETLEVPAENLAELWMAYRSAVSAQPDKAIVHRFRAIFDQADG